MAQSARLRPSMVVVGWSSHRSQLVHLVNDASYNPSTSFAEISVLPNHSSDCDNPGGLPGACAGKLKENEF